jgi:hypothetical protein
MNKKIIAIFIYEFIMTKYHINDGEFDKVTFRDVVDGLKTADDGRFTFNCHQILEAAGIGIDQFKKDLADLLLIFNRT